MAKRITFVYSSGRRAGMGHRFRIREIAAQLSEDHWVKGFLDVQEGRLLDEAVELIRQETDREGRILLDVPPTEYAELNARLSTRPRSPVVAIHMLPPDSKQGFERLRILPGVFDEAVVRNSQVPTRSGLEWIVLSDQIRSLKRTRQPDVKVRLLVNGGGSDASEFLRVVTQALELCKEELFEARVVTLNRIGEPGLKQPESETGFERVSFDDYLPNLQWADACIIQGGTARYECGYLGLPAGYVSIHEQQYHLSRPFIEENLGEHLGILGNITPEELAPRLSTFIEKVRGRRFGKDRLPDGLGAVRIANLLLEQ